MRRLRSIAPFLASILTPVLTSVGDDAQVIRSSRSVLTIYSYGVGEVRRVAPEMPEPKPRMGALSDVVASPPLSSSVPLRPRSSSVDSHFGIAAPTSSSAPPSTSSVPKTAHMSSESVQPGPPNLPSVVSVGWQASPDQSVVGYNVYIGAASHQYTMKQTVGDQTFALLPVNQATIYVVVTAYTVEGIESAPCDELIVPGGSQDTGTATSGVIGAASGAQ